MNTTGVVMALTTTQGRDLAQKIREWLGASGQGDPSGELAEFVDDIENARRVSTWAGVDFERLLPFRLPRSERLRWAAIARNCFIFVPILVTWISLERAVSSFVDAPDGRNFLDHWHSLGIFGLKWVAFIDAFIIFLVIVLTLVIGSKEDGGKERQKLEMQHSGLMAALERDLSGYRYLSIQDINVAAAGTLKSLVSSSGEIEKATAALAESAKEAKDAISGAHETVIRVFDPAVQRLDTVIGSLGQAATVHQALSTLVKELQGGLSQQLDSINGSTSATLEQIALTLDRVLADLESRASAATSNLSGTFTQSASDLSTTAQQISSSFNQQVVGHLNGLSVRLEQVVNSLADVTNDLGRTTREVMVNTATLADDLEAVHKRLAQIASQR